MDLMMIAWRAVKIPALSLVVIEAVAQAGRVGRRFISLRGPDDLEGSGVDYLVGLSVLGTAMLGLAATGLFRPVPLIAGFLGLAAVNIGSGPSSILVAAVRAVARRDGGRRPGIDLPTAGCAALFLGMTTSLIWVLVPETETDSYVSHLAAPDQFLLAGRILIDWVPLPFRIPLPTEMVYALALILGDDRIAKCMSLAAFGAAAAVFASGCVKRGGTLSPWAGPLLAISSANLLFLAPATKHDVPAAAMVVTGFLLLRRRSFLPGALLLGAGAAAKIVYGPLAVLFFFLAIPPRRLILPCLAMAVLPELPWMAKEAFASGNPVYPFGAGLIPTLGWDARNWAAFDTRQRSIGMADVTGALGLAGTWWNYWRVENLLLMLCLPGILLFARRRTEAWIVVAGQLTMLWLTRQPRYALPATWFLAFLVAEEGEKRARGRRLETAAAVAAAGWMIAATFVGAGGAGARRQLWNLALSDTDFSYRKTMTTYAGMTDELKHNHAVRPLVVGDFRTYRMPGRVIHAGEVGETPLIWRIAGESRNVAEMRKRFRQTGADILVLNYVTGFNIALCYQAFSWNYRMLAMYQDFALSHLRTLKVPVKSDMVNGAFAILDISPTPLSPPQASVYTLPGADVVYLQALGMEIKGDFRSELAELEALHKLLPRVRFTQSEVARIRTLNNDYEGAFQTLKPLIERGADDESILAYYGISAYALDRLDIAEDTFRRHLALYQYNTNPVQYRLAHVLYLRTLRSGRPIPSSADAVLLREADGLLDNIRQSPEQISANTRAEAHAYIKGRLADYLAGHGDPAGARRLYEQAIELAPNLAIATIWRGRKAALAGR